MLEGLEALLTGILEQLANLIYIRELKLAGNYKPSSGASVEFHYKIDLFGNELAGSFMASVDFNNILGSLKDIVISAVKSMASSITGGFKRRDLLITATAVTAPIGDVCIMTPKQIGETSALVFTPESLYNNATLPGCIFGAFENVTTLSFSSVGFQGYLPSFVPAHSNKLTKLSVANNTFVGSITPSFNKLNLDWLDVSNNQLSGGLQYLVNSNSLTYLDLSSNNFTNNALGNGSFSLANWIPINFPNLRYYDLRENQFNLTAMASIPYTKLSSNSVMTAMRFNIDGNTVCGDCSIGVQLSGECHLQSCANATALAGVKQTLLSYIEQEVAPGGNLTILHTMRFCAFTTLFLVQYDNNKAPARSVVNVFAGLPETPGASSFVLNARSRTKCPPGRVGATCNYFCQVGWQRQAPSDGKGGYVASPDSGGNDPADVYDNMLPQCLLPIGCGGNCTLGMRVVMYTCADYLETLSDMDKMACELSLTSAALLCATSNTEKY